MSLCAICLSEIEDSSPKDEEHLSYCGCEEDNDYVDRQRKGL